MDMVMEYVSVGGNRLPSAADWDSETGVLAFGAGRNVALAEPLVRRLTSIEPFGNELME